MREYHNFKGVPKLPGGMRNVKPPHILQECILSHPRGAVINQNCSLQPLLDGCGSSEENSNKEPEQIQRHVGDVDLVTKEGTLFTTC